MLCTEAVKKGLTTRIQACVGGMVVEGSVARPGDGLTVQFDLTDNEQSVTVRFAGTDWQRTHMRCMRVIARTLQRVRVESPAEGD